MTERERNNFLELIAVLRTFPVMEIGDMRTGEAIGHYMGLSYMVLMQRRTVIEALQRYVDDLRKNREGDEAGMNSDC